MIFRESRLGGVFEIVQEPFEDQRGFFSRTYDKQLFAEKGLDREWVQENHSYSAHKGTVRGIHFQYPPDCETKLLRVISGEIFFVVIDLRKYSNTFGQWVGVVVSASRRNMLYIPRGCAPGMCTLTADCHLAYKVDNYYNPENEAVIKWDDPDIGIQWPLKMPQVISARDANGMAFSDFVCNHGGIVPEPVKMAI